MAVAAGLHDLGKLAVPSEILDKPSALSDDEWQAIGQHPRIGFGLAAQRLLEPVRQRPAAGRSMATTQ